MACETLQFHGPIGEVILKKHFIYETKKSKLKLDAHDFFCVFVMFTSKIESIFKTREWGIRE